MKKSKGIKALSAGLCAALLAGSMTGCGGSSKQLLDPKNPTTVTVWNYYSGDQLSGFEALVNQFNETVGAEKGIVVVSVSQGSIDNLVTCLLDAVNGKAGAQDVPSAAAIYAESVYILNETESVVPLEPYFTADELAEYVPSFLEEGRLKEGGDCLLLPVSKSTEVFVANATDWAPFEEATGIGLSSITTDEALTAAAKAYYDWSDSLTPDVADDGKALYGRDSVSNYVVIGAKQMGHEIFTVGADGNVQVDLDRDTFKRLWDNYYIPFINGYFASNAKFRSEDIKTGTILAMTGSSSGVSYIPTAVTMADDTTYDIDVSIQESPVFENGDPVSVQQGAGYCIMKTDDAQQLATAEFLKWFTASEQNLEFSISSGYSPVKTGVNDAEKITAAFTVDFPKSQNMLDALLLSAKIYTAGNTYAGRAFNGSKEARSILGTLEDICVSDRAAVVAAMEGGATREEAVAPYSTEEYFDTWFSSLCEQINAAVA